MSDNLDKATATAAALVAAQIASANNVDIEINNRPIANLLSKDDWAMGYFVGCMQAAVQAASGRISQEEELAVLAGSLMKFYGLSADQIGTVMNMNRLSSLQQKRAYLEAMDVGGREMYNYFKKIPPVKGMGEIMCTPRSLFVHLAPSRCLEMDGILVPKTLYVGPLTDGVPINALAVELTKNYLSAKSARPSNSGCAAVLFFAAMPAIPFLLF